MVFGRFHAGGVTNALTDPSFSHAGQEWLNLVVHATGTGMYEFQAGAQDRVWSPQLYAITGLPANAEVNGDAFLKLVHEDDRGLILQAGRHILESPGPHDFDIEYRIVRPDGGIRWVRDIGRAVSNGRGVPARVMGIVQDIDTRKRAEEAWRESEQRFSSILLMSADWYWEQDENLRFVGFSDSVLSLAGSSAESHIGKTRWELPAVGVSDEEWAVHRAQLERREPFRNFEFRRTNESGKTVWLSVSGDPIFDAAGRFKGYRGTGRNITEQKAWDETQRLLVNELNHRVKNTLATVQAIAANTLSRTRDPAHFVETFAGRIQSLACAHTLLTKASWQGADLKALILEQLALRGFVPDGRVAVSGPNVHLDPQVALPMALVIHELSTNACKHGSLSGPKGRVVIKWELVGNGEPFKLQLEWRETDGPMVQPPVSRNFGSVLIERSLSFALGGESKLSFEPEGLTFSLLLPLVSHVDAGVTSPSFRTL